ncbi:hypothetical protein HA402_011100 [Bradysia odoriphaga]|nr:hypothetical protein HA402_011100 [Bradysia odoriphaga]
MYVFVYGTLKRNCPNNYVLEKRENGRAEFVCEARTEVLFPLIVATKYEIPFLLDQTGIGNHVLGEVYDVDEKMLDTLDKFEGAPLLYKRRFEVVKPVDGQGDASLSAWIFTFHSFNEKLLKETFYDTYVCKNYDLLRSLSGKISPEERAKFFKDLRNEL